ncbi:hypothetical protein LINPERHAP2_LOCUS17050 [Linum perenne]
MMRCSVKVKDKLEVTEMNLIRSANIVTDPNVRKSYEEASSDGKMMKYMMEQCIRCCSERWTRTLRSLGVIF